ncbi:MAG: adenylate kinase family protein [Promethearchaeota archaeon]
MILFVTGTPGVGKTVIAGLLSETTGAQVLGQTQLLEEMGALSDYDEERQTFVVDEDELRDGVLEVLNRHREGVRDAIVEGHLTDLLPRDLWDVVVVLRAHPDVIRARLAERGYPGAKIMENVEAEVLSNVAGEVAEWGHPRVYEVRTDLKSAGETATDLAAAIWGTNAGGDLAGGDSGGGNPQPTVVYELGTVNWLDELDMEGTLFDYFPPAVVQDENGEDEK